MRVEDILESLQDRLMNGEFAARTRMRPEDFAAGYGVSPSTIRDLLYRLSSLGLLDYFEQRGFRVPENSAERRHDLTHFRILLESEGTALSIRNGGLDWEAQLSAAHHKLSHIEARVRSVPITDDVMLLWAKAELAFHQTLIAECNSASLKRTHKMIYMQFRQQMITSDREFAFLPENIAQHQAILDAVLARDEERARAMIYSHLSRSLSIRVPEPVAAGI